MPFWNVEVSPSSGSNKEFGQEMTLTSIVKYEILEIIGSLSFTYLSPLVLMSFKPQFYTLFLTSKLTPAEESKWSSQNTSGW